MRPRRPDDSPTSSGFTSMSISSRDGRSSAQSGFIIYITARAPSRSRVLVVSGFTCWESAMKKLTCAALVTVLVLAGMVPVYAGNGRGGHFHSPAVGSHVIVG